MDTDTLMLGGYRLPVYSLPTIVVGTGAAGYNAADRLFAYGHRDIAMVTEHRLAGTSRNTGSDKQTYYKLTMAGGEPDSVRNMAETLYGGGCTDGDLALCEAALSATCFLKLAELGVPFPQNRYGEYTGYKTDHDPKQRATSAGPYTSKMMTERLEAAVMAKDIRIFDHMQAIRVLTDGKRVCGLLCLNTEQAGDPKNAFTLFNCRSIVYATGGPAGMYRDSAYPHGHSGATGLALEAGVTGKNLTEWQFGLASLHPRWNVSGTFMQALPAIVSVGENGDEREFLADYFPDAGAMLSAVFCKGYEWPFDVRKVRGGSSLIDLLVYLETEKGRKVYLDFRQNPGGGEIDFTSLSAQAHAYLKAAGACFGTPVERLKHMNRPAVDFYLDKGVDLCTERLEIALCAQHNNGGLGVDCWWQTNVEGFFAVGEASASHGVYRPGGSALNAGQVGGTRAARYIAVRRKEAPLAKDVFETLVNDQVAEMLAMADRLQIGTEAPGDARDAGAALAAAAARMSRAGGAIRDSKSIQNALRQTNEELAAFPRGLCASGPQNLAQAYRLRDILICQQVYLSAMENYLVCGGGSRGSALYINLAGEKPHEKLPDTLRFAAEDKTLVRMVQEVTRGNGVNTFTWREVRPIPVDDSVFETVWREYREHGNVLNTNPNP